jgi:nucleoside-diphosphate-sugar epimerase
MPSDLVLITGGTGHVGFKVLVEALEAGYSVRAAIRDTSKKQLIVSTKSIQAINPGPRLTFIIVPDITVDSAYDEAVKGVKYVIHVASPLSTASMKPEDFGTLLIEPAVKGKEL